MTGADMTHLEAAAALASVQRSTSQALTAALNFLDHYPAAEAAWEYSVHGTSGPSAALVLTVRHATPRVIAGTFLAASRQEAA